MSWIDDFFNEPKQQLAGAWLCQSIENLATSAPIDDYECTCIINEARSGLTIERANELFKYLSNMANDPVTHGSRYTVTDVNRHIKKLIQ